MSAFNPTCYNCGKPLKNLGLTANGFLKFKICNCLKKIKKMNFKGTQGNWVINPRASRNVRCGKITVANCSGGQNGDSQEEEEANAKLIAKAPEMFRQIKKLREAILSEDYVRMLAESQLSKELLIKITE